MPRESSTASHSFSTGRSVALPALVWSLVWLAANVAWIAADRLPRDGDEEGHVGAAELFRADLLAAAPGEFLSRLFIQDMGDYPSLYPAIEGAWWWLTGVGDPGSPVVRSLGLLWMLLAAGAVGLLGRRVDARTGLAAFVAATLLPLPVGLSRHFMPEGLLVAAVAIAALTAWRAVERPSSGRWALLGLVLGAGLLVKQSFVFLAGPAVVAGLLLGGARGWRDLRTPGPLLSAVVATAVAGPWTWGQRQEQLRYLEASAVGSDGPGLLAHAGFYPMALVVVVAGPVLVLAALPGLGALREPSPARRPVLLATTWLVGATLLLALVPKKYPRLLAPVAPAVALLAGVAVGRSRHPLLAGGSLVVFGGAWLGLRSLTPTPTLPAGLQAVVPGCPQQWLRAPVDDDLGLSAIADVVRQAPSGPLQFDGGPAIPCSLQTSPPLVSHISPYLRRVGLDRDILSGNLPDAGSATDAVLRFTWVEGEPTAGLLPASEARPGAIPIARLGGWYRVEAPR